MRFSPPYVLAFDVGTTGCKGVLVDSEGLIIRKLTKSYPSVVQKTGRLEQDPLLWWKAVTEIASTILKKINPTDVSGLGFCGTMAAALPVDKNGRPLRNAMLYSDVRGTDQVTRLASEFNAKDVYCLTGNPLSPVYSLSKWMWIRENENKIFEKTWKFIQPKDFLVHKLTGEIVTDYVDASATMAFDVTRREWAEELLEFARIPLDKLPETRSSISIAGEVTSKAAEELRLKKGTPVIVGCGDTAALLAGARAVIKGTTTVYLGAAAEIDVTTDRPMFNPRALIPVRCHAVPNMWFNSASAMTSGTALRWFVKQFCTEGESYKEMDRKAAKLCPGSDGLIFLPYLSGERMPIWDSKAKGAFIGISMASSKAHFYRSVLEGVAFSLRSIRDAYLETKIKFEQASISGGGAESSLWKQIVIDVLGFRCDDLAQPEEASALGVAMYINAALNGKRHLSEMADKFAPIKKTVLPNREKTAEYDRLYKIYSRCYPALKEIMHQL